MQELVPYISCLVSPHEFNEALNSTYSEIYVPTAEGYLKHMKLRGGRHIRLKVPALPASKGTPVNALEIKEELNFLPAGKIPYSYFEQIVHFFKEVMRLKKADYEAHAWILWSETKGYYISIPKQTASKASVKFSYDQEDLPADSIVVVDIHSHNTMNAFYSGTDNANDRMGIYYSGVVGKLDTANPQVVFRFNMHEVKQECKLADIFIMDQKEVEIPKEWMDQVQVQAPVVHSKFSNSNPNHMRHPSLWESMISDITKDPLSYHKAVAASIDRSEISGVNAILDEQARELNEQAGAHLDGTDRDDTIYVDSGYEMEVYGAEGKPIGADDDDEDDPVGKGPDYDYYVSQYGKDAAEAKSIIDDLITDLSNCDEGLLEIIRDAYQLLGDAGKYELATNGF